MNTDQIKKFIDHTWDNSIIPSLIEYIKIPNKSPSFDPEWEKNGYMDQAMDLIHAWCQQHALPDMQMQVVRLPGRTPLLFIDIPGQIDDTVLLYGHMDKQPEMTGWDADLGPWKPVLREGKLYGRGGADDGYSAYGSLTAIKALQEQNIPHARCVVLIEGCEESGSYDLPYYIDYLKEQIGNPSLVICLDSGASNYKQLWTTTNLRGVITAKLEVQILREGVHSGYASGIVPDSFQIVRQLLSRVQDENTGEIILSQLQVEIPQQRIEQAQKTAEVVGEGVIRAQPFVEGAKPMLADVAELILNRTWRATLTVIGIDDIPAVADGGNVLRPKTTVKLSFRAPPTCNVVNAGQAIKKALETNPPYNAKVTCEIEEAGPGWNAPEVAPWLDAALQEASETYFQEPAMYLGEGGSIPFMGMLGEKFPEAQFFITGVLGPKSNAHGPNEFLHIPMGKQVTCCVAHVLAKQAESK
jgi:acetylornithine deacetylase/succinyl-diaminopimelate desuccinylase-like protein